VLLERTLFDLHSDKLCYFGLFLRDVGQGIASPFLLLLQTLLAQLCHLEHKPVFALLSLLLLFLCFDGF